MTDGQILRYLIIFIIIGFICGIWLILSMLTPPNCPDREVGVDTVCVSINGYPYLHEVFCDSTMNQIGDNLYEKCVISSLIYIKTDTVCLTTCEEEYQNIHPNKLVEPGHNPLNEEE